jgi:hypothetical protein
VWSSDILEPFSFNIVGTVFSPMTSNFRFVSLPVTCKTAKGCRGKASSDAQVSKESEKEKMIILDDICYLKCYAYI